MQNNDDQENKPQRINNARLFLLSLLTSITLATITLYAPTKLTNTLQIFTTLLFACTIAILIKIIVSPKDYKKQQKINHALFKATQGNINAALQEINTIINDTKISPIIYANAHLIRGQFHIATQNYQDAIKDYNTVINNTQNIPQQFIIQAFLLKATAITENENSTEKIAEAINHTDAVIQAPTATDQQRANAHITRGYAKARLNQHIDAINDQTIALDTPKISPQTKAQALINRGHSHTALNNIQLADKDYNTIINTKDCTQAHKAWAHFNKAKIQATQNKTLEAIQNYSSVIQMKNADPQARYQAYFNRAQKFLNHRHYTSAIKDYTTLIQTKNYNISDIHIAYINRSFCNLKLNHYQLAIQVRLRPCLTKHPLHHPRLRIQQQSKRKPQTKKISTHHPKRK